MFCTGLSGDYDCGSRMARLAKEQSDAAFQQGTPDGPTPDPSPNPGEPHRPQLSLVYELLRCGSSFGLPQQNMWVDFGSGSRPKL